MQERIGTSPVTHCTILFPGLLGPAVPLMELPRAEWPDKTQLPLLASLLTLAHRTNASPQHSVEALLLHNLGYAFTTDGELPVAALRMTTEPEEAATLWCLDPVYVQLDREMAYLAVIEELALSEAEARELIASLNQHFGDDLHIQYHQPQQWLVSLNLRLRTHTPSEALQQDVKRMQATGEDAPRWINLLNEVQMLLHHHPVNQQRLEHQHYPVNSLWLWGGGRLELTQSNLDVVYSDHPLTATAAARNAISHESLPERYTASMFENKNVLILLTEQLSAIRQKDVYAWFAALRRLEAKIFQVVFPLLRQNRIDMLTVCSEQLSLNLDKKALQKWWRRPQCLDSAILQLRDDYAREA